MICPDCKGEGGEWETVLWKGPGGGPYYECCYCDGDGKVPLFKYLYWKIFVVGFGEKLVRNCYRIKDKLV